MASFIQDANMQFMNFVLKYDTSDWNINRKIIHTFSVAEKCFYIACRLNLPYKQRNLAYLAGLLHDVGRFEQWKNFHTYCDKDSCDHADLSVEIVKNTNYFHFDSISSDDMDIVLLAVKHHNKQYEGKDKKIKLLNVIVMAADAYSNILSLANGSHMLFTDENGFTEEIVDKFINLKPLYHDKPNTKLDRILCLMAGLYYVRFDFLKEELTKNNIINIIAEEYDKYLTAQDKKTFYSVLKLFKKNYNKFSSLSFI